MPFVLLHELYGLDYGRLIEAFTKADRERFPVVKGITDFFRQKARDIQNGSWEYCPSEKWLKLVWPAYQHALIGLVQNGKLNAFYEEAKGILLEYTRKKVHPDIDPFPVVEAVDFNRQLFPIPFPELNLKIRLQHNLWEFYQGVLAGKPVSFEARPSEYAVWRTRPVFKHFENWLEYMIYCHTKKQKFLYPCHSLPSETKHKGAAPQSVRAAVAPRE